MLLQSQYADFFSLFSTVFENLFCLKCPHILASLFVLHKLHKERGPSFYLKSLFFLLFIPYNKVSANIICPGRKERGFHMVTLKDIAERAGVSIMTVSRVMNDKKGKVSPETSERVRRIAEEMGYIPNSTARSLAARSSKIIAVILRDEPATNPLEIPYNAAFLGKIVKILPACGYSIMVHFVQNFSDVTFWLKSWNAEGAIFLGIFDREIRQIRNDNQIPLVFTDSYSNVRRINNVGIDDYKGGQLAAECFLSHGHTRLAFAGPISSGVIAERLQGFSDRLRSSGHPLLPEQTHAFPDRSAADILKSILESDPAPTGLFVTSDNAAAEFYEAARRAGVSIPDDLSVIGFDDFPVSQMLTPALTTIRQDMEEKAQQTCRILLDRLNNCSSPSEILCLDVNLVERDSVRDLRPPAASPSPLTGERGESGVTP